MKDRVAEITPRGLQLAQAARYIGIGATKFGQMVADGRMPKARRIDGRKVWDCRELDDAFDALPPAVARRVFEGIDAVLTGRDRRDDFAHMDDETRTAIREILMATKPEFAEHVAGRESEPGL